MASEARRGGLVCGDFLKTAFPETHTNSRRMRYRAVSPKEKAAKVTAFPYCRTPYRTTSPREGNFRRIAPRCVVCRAGGCRLASRCRRLCAPLISLELDLPELCGSPGCCSESPVRGSPGSRSGSSWRCSPSRHRGRPGASRYFHLSSCTGRSMAT